MRCEFAATLDPDSFDRSNYMHRAMIRVAYKFAHELSVFEMLKKVNTWNVWMNLFEIMSCGLLNLIFSSVM